MKKKARLVREFLSKPYARVIIPAGDGSYAAELLEFPGCFTQGGTAQEALENLDDAAVAWIEAAIEQKQEIPEPLAAHGYSGKISLRIPRSIHKKAARFAQKDDVSLNQFLSSAIAARVGAEEICDRILERIQSQVAPAPSAIQVRQVVSSITVAGTGPTFSLVDSAARLFPNQTQVATTSEVSQPLKAISNESAAAGGV